MVRHFTFFRGFVLLAAGAMLGLGSCGKSKEESIDPVVPPPTPYTLTVPAGFPTPIIPADNPLTNEGVALGRMLFYET